MKIVQLCPRIYEHETIYSIVARLLYNDVSSSVSQAMDNLLENRNVQLDAALPSFLIKLQKITLLDAKSLVNHHSVFPYYASFATDKGRALAEKYMLRGEGHAAFKSLGLLASRLPDESQLKYCPCCANEQMQTYGETYWLRAHQLPLVSTCLKHHVNLRTKTRKRKHLYFPYANQQYEYTSCPVAIKIAEISKLVLEEPQLDSVQLLRCYVLRLIGLGFATHTSLRLQKWTVDMTMYYQPIMGDPRVSWLFSHKNEHGFPANIFYADNSSHHPIKHILIIAHLFEHVGDFVVAYSQTNKSQKKSIDYSVVTAQKDIDKTRQVQVLRELENGKSLRQITKVAGVAASTVRNIASQYGYSLEQRERKLSAEQIRAITIKLMIGWSTDVIAENLLVSKSDVEQVLAGQLPIKTLRQRIRFFNRRKLAREMFLKVVNRTSSFKVKDAKEQCYADYMWLYKHDPEWLKNTVSKATRTRVACET